MTLTCLACPPRLGLQAQHGRGNIRHKEIHRLGARSKPIRRPCVGLVATVQGILQSQSANSTPHPGKEHVLFIYPSLVNLSTRRAVGTGCGSGRQTPS
jgi:hypothetical protein